MEFQWIARRNVLRRSSRTNDHSNRWHETDGDHNVRYMPDVIHASEYIVISCRQNDW